MKANRRLFAVGILAAMVACGDEDPLKPRLRPGPGDDAAQEEGAGDKRLDFSSAPLRRLTRGEIKASLNVLMPGFPVDDEMIRALPEDSVSPFDNDATAQNVSERLISSVNNLAEKMSAAFVSGAAPRETVLGCTPTGNRDDACLRSFAERFGKRAFRRPLTSQELDGMVARFGPLGEKAQSFPVAAGRVIASVLQDVEFLYRIETGEPLPTNPGQVALNDYAIGTRMAALLWGGVPDDSVLAHADRGELGKAAGRRAAAEEMLASPAARAHIARFHALWVGYETSLPGTAALSAGIRQKLRAESDALIQRVVFDEHRSWLDIWRSTETFIDDELAAFYGDVPKPGSATAKWSSYGTSKRKGLFGHGSLYNVDNKFEDTSPTQRGKMVRERLLCQPVPKTPPDLKVDVDEPPKAGKCKTDGYRSVLAQPGCAGCHKSMDLIGFGLENFDIGGRFRTFEPLGQDCPLDGKGTLVHDGAEKPFTGPSELVDLLVQSKDLEACLGKRVVQYALGRPDGAGDKETLEAIADVFTKNNERLDSILIEIVSAPSFALKKVD